MRLGSELEAAVSTPRNRVTSLEVAQHSGVSRATVSYVLNGTPNQTISAETRQRVLDAAERLGYTPYAPARALRSGRSDVVVFLLPEWPIGASIARLVEDLTRALVAARLTLVMHVHLRSARPVGDLWRAITPAAVINHQALNDVELQAVRRTGIPVITPIYDVDGISTFADFQRRIGFLQADHLVANGHRRVGFALTDDDRLCAFSEPRLDGVRQACAEADVAEPLIQTVALDAASASGAIGRWRRTRPSVTGICAYNDEVALAVLAGMRRLSLVAPTDLAVIGVDDIPTARLAAPPLTTIITDWSAVARHLAATIVAALAGEAEPPRPGSDIMDVVRRESA